MAEEYARDSLENLLYSVCRFKVWTERSPSFSPSQPSLYPHPHQRTSMQEFTGHYPREITVVSFGFKQDRFEAHHRAALRFPQVNQWTCRQARPAFLPHT